MLSEFGPGGGAGSNHTPHLNGFSGGMQVNGEGAIAATVSINIEGLETTVDGPTADAIEGQSSAR